MPKQKITKAKQLMSVRELYDLFMYEVEPDLMTDVLPNLDLLYAGETKENRKARMQRYGKAVQLFTERFAAFLGQWENVLQHFKKDILRTIQHGATEDEAKKLSNLLESLDNA